MQIKKPGGIFMNKVMGVTRRVLFAYAAIVGGTSVANAQQVLTSVQSADYSVENSAETKVSTTPGQVVTTTYGGADTRATTDYGVNKVTASGTALYEQAATSAWIDTYTVAGALGSTVSVAFRFAIDGLADFDAASYANFNFNVFALRGSGWSLSGANFVGPQWYSPFAPGTLYENPVLTQVQPNRITEADMRNFSGFYNYQNAGGAPGAFLTKNAYDPLTDSFFMQTSASGMLGGTRYFASGYQSVNSAGVAGAFIPYTSNPTAGATRTSLVANYSLLASDQLCAGETCGSGTYPGSTLELTFDVAANSVFTLAALLYVDDLNAGTIDFFHTAKVSSVTLSPGATITSASGTLLAKADGSYGYVAADAAAAVSAAPEPATWAMMILGVSLVGITLRRSRRRVLATA